MNHDPRSGTDVPPAAVEGDLQPIGRTGRVIEVHAERRHRRAGGAFDFDQRRAVRRVLAMNVVERQRAADPIAVVQDDRAPRVAKGFRGPGCGSARQCTPTRFARQPPDRVEIVDRVVQHLEPGRAGEERPLLPRLAIDDADLDVGDLAEAALRR